MLDRQSCITSKVILTLNWSLDSFNLIMIEMDWSQASHSFFFHLVAPSGDSNPMNHLLWPCADGSFLASTDKDIPRFFHLFLMTSTFTGGRIQMNPTSSSHGIQVLGRATAAIEKLSGKNLVLRSKG